LLSIRYPLIYDAMLRADSSDLSVQLNYAYCLCLVWMAILSIVPKRLVLNRIGLEGCFSIDCM